MRDGKYLGLLLIESIFAMIVGLSNMIIIIILIFGRRQLLKVRISLGLTWKKYISHYLVIHFLSNYVMLCLLKFKKKHLESLLHCPIESDCVHFLEGFCWIWFHCALLCAAERWSETGKSFCYITKCAINFCRKKVTSRRNMSISSSTFPYLPITVRTAVFLNFIYLYFYAFFSFLFSSP